MYFLWKLVLGSLALAFTQHHTRNLVSAVGRCLPRTKAEQVIMTLTKGAAKVTEVEAISLGVPDNWTVFFFFFFKPRVLRSVYLFCGYLSFCTHGLMSWGPLNHCACTVILAQLPLSWTHSQARRLRQRMDLSHCLHGADLLVTQSRDANRLVASEMS